MRVDLVVQDCGDLNLWHTSLVGLMQDFEVFKRH